MKPHLLIAAFSMAVLPFAGRADGAEKKESATPAADTPAVEEKKPGFFKRLLGKPEAKSVEAPTPAPAPKKTATAAAADGKLKVSAADTKPPPPAAPEKPGIFKRLLGKSGAKTEATVEPGKKDSDAVKSGANSAGSEKQKKKADVAAAPAAPPELEPEKEKKPGFFSKLFGGRSSGDAWSDGGPKPPRPADWQTRHVVTEDEVPIYAYGPSQPTGPDERLAKGTIVSMKQAGKSWSRITTEDGRSFMIGTVQLRPAEESDFSEPQKAVAAGPSGSAEYYEPLPPPNLPEMSPGGPQSSGDLLIPLPPLPPP